MNFPFQQQQQQPQVEALIISDLPLECREPDLLQLAQHYGRIKSCEIKRDFRNHVITMYGILYYYAPEGAMAAYRAINGARYMGKILRVSWMSQPHNMQQAQFFAQPQQNQNKGSKTAQVHISYISKQLNFIITEQFLRDIFQNFGNVVEISLKKTCVDPEMSVQNGYGFVHYPLNPEGIQSALAAVNNLHQVTMNQVTFDCSVSNQLNQILLNGERQNQRQRRAGGVPPASMFMTSSPTPNLPNQDSRMNGTYQFDPYQLPMPRSVFHGVNFPPPTLTHMSSILPQELRPHELNMPSAGNQFPVTSVRQRPKPYSPFQLPTVSGGYSSFPPKTDGNGREYNSGKSVPYGNSESSSGKLSDSQYSSFTDSSKTPTSLSSLGNYIPPSMTNDSVESWSDNQLLPAHLSNGLLDPFLGTPFHTPRTYVIPPTVSENHSLGIPPSLTNLSEPESYRTTSPGAVVAQASVSTQDNLILTLSTVMTELKINDRSDNVDSESDERNRVLDPQIND